MKKTNDPNGLLERITGCLSGLDFDLMTQTEGQIVNLLVCGGYVDPMCQTPNEEQKKKQSANSDKILD